MKIFNYVYKGLEPLDNLKKLVYKEDVLFFDIETTGLSKVRNHIYLIGVGFYDNDSLNIVQWFVENESEEPLVLKEFVDFSSSFTCLVNYNGKSFDIPFTTERMNKYGIVMPDLNSLDIYTLIKPLKKLLSLNDLSQKSIEQFININREDMYNGGELINVYKQYVRFNNSSSYCSYSKDAGYIGLNIRVESKAEALDLLLLHNKEDVLNMHYLTKILDYNDINYISLEFDRYDIKNYTDYSGNEKKELLISGLHNCISLPRSFNNFINIESGSYIMNFSNKGSIMLRVPIIDDTLNYYIDNYKDYYYLPKEDICILKSMAGGVLKENRTNASKETCHVKLKDSFIPIPNTNELENIRLFRSSYKSKTSYIRISDFEQLPMSQKNIILENLYNLFK